MATSQKILVVHLWSLAPSVWGFTCMYTNMASKDDDFTYCYYDDERRAHLKPRWCWTMYACMRNALQKRAGCGYWATIRHLPVSSRSWCCKSKNNDGSNGHGGHLHTHLMEFDPCAAVIED